MEGALQDLEAAQAESARRLTASFAGALTDVEMSLQARESICNARCKWENNLGLGCETNFQKLFLPAGHWTVQASLVLPSACQRGMQYRLQAVLQAESPSSRNAAAWGSCRLCWSHGLTI